MSIRGLAVKEAPDHSIDGLTGHGGNSEGKAVLNGSRENKSAPLCQAIDQALERYFQDLDGTAPNDLYAMVMQQVEQPLLRRVLSYTDGNQSRAAEILGINRTTLRKKLRTHGLID
ncbi:DNA-binding transcriptional regulator Fis [Gammaproteobacteria bacterium AB-CW1]|uniref:Putative Fis-like DNA-binding protein n=1 Tax=Natronospira elongata TaxID=3110268 RepID=A0AAP6JFK4_9GAMM|nr:DNA-binding transcriptional regulator Fis [Gammaproteobacteria bacterium AB-CW1]